MLPDMYGIREKLKKIPLLFGCLVKTHKNNELPSYSDAQRAHAYELDSSRMWCPASLLKGNPKGIAHTA